MTDRKLIEKYSPADYEDGIAKTIETYHPIVVDELFDRMFGNFPWPVRALLRLRDAMVKPLGLKTGATFRDRIIERNEEEIVIGVNDKHLDFWVSVYCSPPSDREQTAAVTTVVKYNNILGRIYFSVIWVFHKLLVSGLLSRALKKNK